MWSDTWKALSLLALVVALLAPAASASPNGRAAPPPVICGTPCDGGGGGWTGCTQASASDSGGVPYVAGYRHVLVVSYCKRFGTITSISIAAHYCDTSGFVGCLAGPAWQTGGGVGYGYASYTGHAVWTGTIAGAPYNTTSVVNLTIPYGQMRPPNWVLLLLALWIVFGIVPILIVSLVRR